MKKTVVIITSIIFINNTQAQVDFNIQSQKTRPGFTLNVSRDALSFYNTTTDFFENTIRIDNYDLVLAGIITGATALSSMLDNPIRNNMTNLHSPSMDKFTKAGEYFGDGKYGLALSGVLYLGGHFIKDDELRKTGLMLGEAIFINGLTTLALKVVMGRSRPFTNEGNHDIDLFQLKFEDEENSLPSGHSSTAFAVATILSNRIDNIYASIALYSFAGFTAFQRIYDDKHWFSDTVLGAALGTVIGLKVIYLNSDDETADSGAKLDITPVFLSGGYGVGINLAF